MLKIDAGTLSRLLRGAQVPSYRMAERILAPLELPRDVEEHFLSSLAEAQQSRGLQRMSPLFKTFRAKL